MSKKRPERLSITFPAVYTREWTLSLHMNPMKLFFSPNYWANPSTLSRSGVIGVFVQSPLDSVDALAISPLAVGALQSVPWAVGALTISPLTVDFLNQLPLWPIVPLAQQHFGLNDALRSFFAQNIVSDCLKKQSLGKKAVFPKFMPKYFWKNEFLSIFWA